MRFIYKKVAKNKFLGDFLIALGKIDTAFNMFNNAIYLKPYQ